MQSANLVRKIVLTLELNPREADLDTVKRHFEIRDDEIDPRFGVMEINANRHLYAIRLEPAAARRVSRRRADAQTWSDPVVGATDR